MFIKNISIIAIALTIAGCTQNNGWNSQYGETPVSAPAQMQNVVYYPDYNVYGDAGMESTRTPANGQKNVCVLLPLSGNNASVGTGISNAIQTAFLQKKYSNISVKFIDMSGDRVTKIEAAQSAISSNPDIIIGPVFAEDVKILRTVKPSNIPALSFSSDITAVGDGVMTTALMPTQSVEVIMKQVVNDHAKKLLILAPDTASGKIMAGAAVQSANVYDVPVAGLYYYSENNSDSVKQIAEKASMWNARSAANTRGREILSDILNKENLTPEQKSSVALQLDKLSKSETLGKPPYDSVLFLGNAADSKSLASFLRYYEVGMNVGFYGTALWDNQDLLNDLTMSGAKFAALPSLSTDFATLYERTYGTVPSRLDSFGFDAANLAIGMLLSNKDSAAYLLDPSGYRGIDGLVRLRPNGEDERALQILELNGSGIARMINPAPTDFIKTIYQVNPRDNTNPGESELTGGGINPNDYITIPENLKSKYRSKTYGANTAAKIDDKPVYNPEDVVVIPDDDTEVIKSPDFQPVNLETVDRKLIDSVEVKE